MSKTLSPLRTRTAKYLTVGVLIAASFAAGCAVAAQPHMVNALNALRNARAELQVAEHNKGGHRVAAIDLIDRAIAQVQMGIDVAR